MNKQRTAPVEKPQPRKQPATSSSAATFLFGRRNYIILLSGIVLMAIGFLLMMGGNQPPDQFDESEIYSFRRTTLSSLVVFIGLLVVLYSIFVGSKKD